MTNSVEIQTGMEIGRQIAGIWKEKDTFAYNSFYCQRVRLGSPSAIRERTGGALFRASGDRRYFGFTTLRPCHAAFTSTAC